MIKRHFNKLTVIGHIVQINDDGSVEDLQTPENTIKDEEAAIEFIATVRAEIAEFNAAQPNRKQRRSTHSIQSQQ